MAISLGEVRLRAAQFVTKVCRVDQVGLDEPRPTGVVPVAPRPPIRPDLPYYPPSRLLVLPARNLEYDLEPWGVKAVADLPFELTYRFPGSLRYQDLPLTHAHNLLSRLYLKAISRPGDLGAKKVQTPDAGIEVRVGRLEATQGAGQTDWLITLEPTLRVTFQLGDGATSDLQPDTDLEPWTIEAITIGIYRNPADEALGSENARLDRTLTYTLEAQ